MSERGNGSPPSGGDSREREGSSQEEETEFVLEAEEGEDLEAAFKEALDAVDRKASEAPEEVSAEQPSDGGREAALAAELRSTQDRLMRALADFDNYRKRVERERSEDRLYRGFEVLRDLLPIIDNLERALDAGGSVEDLKTGVRLTLKQMIELLERNGVRRIESIGSIFDPRVHEALSHFPDPKVEEPTVSEELEAGYAMRERLLRAARVTVAMPHDEEEGAAEE